MEKISETTSEFRITRAIRKKIFEIPLLPQEEILPRFQELDQLLYPHALKLTERFPRLRDYFQEVMFRIASGNTLGKNYYDKEDREDDKADKKILKNSEKRILAQSFSLLRLRDQPARFVHVAKQAGFLRGVFEEAIELFLEICASYPEDLEDLAEAAKNSQPIFTLLEKKVHGVENELEFYSQSELAAQVSETREIWAKYVKLRENIVAPYFRMVYTLAKNSSPNNDPQILNNFQNGIFGLFRAVKCYTPSRFAAFSVVAKSWIRQSILLNLKSEVNLIKLPVASWHVFQKLEKVRQKIEQKNGKEATYEQIAKAAKIPFEKVQKVYENAKLVQVLSLNTPTHTEDDQSTGARWNLESVPARDDERDRFELRSEYRLIEQVVQQFDEEERIIFGLISGCFDLIPEPELDPALILKESIRQRAARRGLGVIFKE